MLTLLFFLNFISIFSLKQPFNLTEQRKVDLEKMIKSQLELAKLHTIGIVITNKAETIFQKEYIENNKTSENSRFIIGSVSKSFTALAVLKSGVELNNTLNYFGLSEYIDDKKAKKITISELLNHTSGLVRFGSKVDEEKKGKFSYSNYGYALLGKIIKNNNKMEYKEFVQKNIFDELNMSSTSVDYPTNISDSYDNFFGFRTKYGGLKSEIEQRENFYVPAGFISTTLEDMGKYLRYYLKNESDGYISKMTESNLSVGYKEYYGMGLYIGEKNGNKVYHHGGATNSFQSHLYIYPDLELGFFVVTNTRDSFCSQLTEELFDNIESFLLFDTYKGISNYLFIFIHFSIDIIIIFIIAIPLSYLIVTIVRKIQKKKATWFNGVKGIIVFIVDIIFLILLPLTIIILLYVADADVTYAVKNTKDILFVLFTFSSILFLTFIIKLVYFFIYNKYLKNNEKVDIKKIEENDMDYMLGENVND